MLKSNIKLSMAIIILTGIIGLMAAPAVSAGDVAKMSIDELKNRMGSDKLIILDVRTGRDRSSSEFKIKGARRAGYMDFEQWSADLPKSKTLVLYCA